MPQRRHLVPGEICMSKLLHCLTLLCSILAMQIAMADDTGSMNQTDPFGVPADRSVRSTLHRQASDADQDRRSDEIQEKISALVRRKAELVESREDSTMGVGDYIVAVILPGGLLYAGYKKRELYLAKKDLVEVNAEIDRYVDDLDALQAAPGSIVLAPQHLVDIDGLVHPY